MNGTRCNMALSYSVHVSESLPSNGAKLGLRELEIP